MDAEIFNVVFDNADIFDNIFNDANIFDDAIIFDDADILNIYMKMPLYSKYI